MRGRGPRPSAVSGGFRTGRQPIEVHMQSQVSIAGAASAPTPGRTAGVSAPASSDLHSPVEPIGVATAIGPSSGGVVIALSPVAEALMRGEKDAQADKAATARALAQLDGNVLADPALAKGIETAREQLSPETEVFEIYENEAFRLIQEEKEKEAKEARLRGLEAAEAEADTPAEKAIAEKGKLGADGLTEEERRVVAELKARDAEVRAHEQAHVAAAAGLAGAPSYSYQTGPDGKRYAIGGSVSIDTSPGRTADETIAKAKRIRAAALAPAGPSGTDRAVAARASQMEVRAQQVKSQETSAEAEALRARMAEAAAKAAELPDATPVVPADGEYPAPDAPTLEFPPIEVEDNLPLVGAGVGLLAKDPERVRRHLADFSMGTAGEAQLYSDRDSVESWYRYRRSG